MTISCWGALNDLNGLIRMMESQTRYLRQALDEIEAEKERAVRLRAEMQPLAEMLEGVAADLKSAEIDAAATHPAPATAN